MSKRCRSDAVIAPEERNAFVTANAVALLAERDELVRRLRREITLHLKGKRDLRQEVARLRELVVSLGGTP